MSEQNEQMVNRLGVIERGLGAEVAECGEAIAAANTLLHVVRRLAPPDSLDSWETTLRSVRACFQSRQFECRVALARCAHARARDAMDVDSSATGEPPAPPVASNDAS